jgi:hypothetical protein
MRLPRHRYRRFDQALVWLLQCIQELSEWAASEDPLFKQQFVLFLFCSTGQ